MYVSMDRRAYASIQLTYINATAPTVNVLVRDGTPSRTSTLTVGAVACLIHEVAATAVARKQRMWCYRR